MEENKLKGKKDPNDPIWLAHQTCWACGKTGHLHQKCTAMQEEKDAYCGRKDTEGAKVNAVEPKEYGMLAGNLSSPTLEALGQKGEQTSDCGVLEILAVQSDSF